MAFTNFDTKEINCKIVYFGPKGAGKSANLRSILAKSSSEVKAGLFEIEDVGSTPYFEFLPVSLGYVKDYHIKLHLYTLPPFSLYESVVSTILKGIDGWVFVCDSRQEALYDNVSALEKARALLAAEGLNLGELPFVMQYNHTDAVRRVPLDLLRRDLNPQMLPDREAAAPNHLGTLETLHLMADQILAQLAPIAETPMESL